MPNAQKREREREVAWVTNEDVDGNELFGLVVAGTPVGEPQFLLNYLTSMVQNVLATITTIRISSFLHLLITMPFSVCVIPSATASTSCNKKVYSKNF